MSAQVLQENARRIAVVTGAARGIGLATARRLAEDGCQVLALDRLADALEPAVAALVAEGLDVTARAVDVTDEAAMTAAFDTLPRVDALVAAAGIASVFAVEDLSVEEFRRIVDVNLTGVFIAMREAARRMTAGGRIVAIASRGILGDHSTSHYIASKAGVVGLVRAFAFELRPRLIAVNAVAPGFTDTDMIRELGAERMAASAAREPRGHAADPAEIAHAIAFFASDHTQFVTGQTLFVDGGKSIGGLTGPI
jgi:3-oxoacyl-[acyl-carrier protein] reductase